MRRFVVVTGLPGSGKSTVGRAIAQALGLPLLDKDEILESLFESLGVGGSDHRARLSRAADAILQRVAEQSAGAVIVSWWRRPESEATSGTSSTWLSSLSGEVAELYCRCAPQVAIKRFFSRLRHAGHLDHERSAAEELPRFEQYESEGPLGIGRLVEVTTEQPVELDTLLVQLTEAWANPSIERTASSGLRPPPAAAHVER
jgi:gluconate kinase